MKMFMATVIKRYSEIDGEDRYYVKLPRNVTFEQDDNLIISATSTAWMEKT